MVSAARFLACLAAAAFTSCGTVEQNSWTYGIAREDAMETSRLIHESNPNCKIQAFTPHLERNEIYAYTNCKVFVAKKAQGRWKLTKKEVIVL
jgi:hypothetical protein